METTSTVLRFSTLCALFSPGLAILVTDSLDTNAVTDTRNAGNGLEVASVEFSVVKLFSLFVFWVDCSKVDAVLCKLGLVFVVPLLTCVGVAEVNTGSFSKRNRKELLSIFNKYLYFFVKAFFFKVPMKRKIIAGYLKGFSKYWRMALSFLKYLFSFVLKILIGSLSKPRRRRRRERHQTKGLMSKTIAVHVRYKSLYISSPSCAKQQREMTKFCVVHRTWTTTVNFSYFHLELNAVVAY